MSKIQPDPYPEQDEPEPPFQRLTAEQAQALRALQPSMSLWRMVMFQALAGLVVALFALGAHSSAAAWSAGYGALTVVLPSAIMAHGLTGRLASVNAATAALGFLVWEGVKILLSVAMLLLAGRLIDGLSWPALLVGLVVTMKIHWLVLGFGRGLIFKKQN
ncbi:MAG: ATP synthase subunit I [Alphaproteobacteria bacterium]|nr:ATP synthase subunit I [Alphaproteobacteria bacterium]